MRAVFNKIPLTIRITPIQYAVLNSRRYDGSTARIVRFFIDKLVNDELPAELKQELRELLEQERRAA